MAGDARDPPDDEDAPSSEGGAPVGDPRDHEDAAPAHAATDDEDDDDEVDRSPYERVEGDDPEAPPLAPAVIHRFLATTKALGIAKKVIRKLVPKDEVEELATDALVSALTAPPAHLEPALPGWFAMIARRTAAHWLRKNTRRAKYRGPMPVHVAREDDYSGEPIETADPTDFSYDPGADADPVKLLGDELDHFIGDHRRDLEVRAMIRENSEGKTYASIAAARGLTEAQVANRILRFKTKYTARVQRRRDRMLFLWILGGAAALLVAGVVAYLLLRHRTDDIHPDPARFKGPPSPTATASTPVFDQALPTPPEPSDTPDTPDRKPKPPRPPVP